MAGEVKHGTSAEAHQHFCSQLDMVAAGRSWGAAVFQVKDDGHVAVGLTTWDFPHRLHDEAMEKLKKMLDDRVRPRLLPDAPLPKAPGFDFTGPRILEAASMSADGGCKESSLSDQGPLDVME